MRRILVNLFAAVGMYLVFGSLLTWGFRRYADGGGGIFVTGPGKRPAVGAPVFLDRGDGLIERYQTDSRGQFSFPLGQSDVHRVKWLICVPGAIPMVGYPEGDRLTRIQYQFSPQEAGKPAFYRSWGWLGPIPRECPPALDSVGWRIPNGSGYDPGRVTFTEPAWAPSRRQQ